MNQSRVASATEAVVNTVVGLALASIVQMAICRYYGIPMSWHNNLIITGWMTGLSVLRGYLLRRAWNAEWWKRFKSKGTEDKIRRITLTQDALMGMRPLTLEEQRELLLRLRTQHRRRLDVAEALRDRERSPDGSLAVGPLQSPPDA